MYDRRRFLRIFGIDAKEFARKHGIIPFEADCYRCGAKQEPTIPFAYDEFRGLIAPVCTCGHPTPPYCIVRVDGALPVPRSLK